jgi:hypothetical protein
VSPRTVAGLPRPVAAAALAVGLFTAVFILLLAKGSSFHTDDWSFVLARAGHSPGVFLEPHNEHLSLVPVTIYKVLLELVGLDHFEVFRLVLVLVNLAGAGVLLVLVARESEPVWALLATVPVALMGAAWSGMVSPFQVSFSMSMLAGLCALLALDRRSLRGDLAACALLLVALASSGLGLPWLVVAGLELLLRRPWLRRVWVILVPFAAYLAWYAVYGERTGSGLEDPISFAANAAAAVVGGYVGLDAAWGRTLVVLGLVLAGWRISRLGRVPLRTVSALGGALAFWGLTGLVRDPATFGESRYLLPGAIWVVLAAAPLLPKAPPTRQQLLVGSGAVACFLIAGSAYFVGGRRVLVDGNRPTYARLLAVELARDEVAPGFQPDAARVPHVRAEPYLAALGRYAGSPAMTLAEARAADPGSRREFDEALVGALGLALAPATGRAGGTCEVAEGEPLDMAVPAGGIQLDVPDGGDATVALRRLGDPGEGGPTLTAPAGAESALAIPADRLEEPWHATVTGPAGTRVCGIG